MNSLRFISLLSAVVIFFSCQKEEEKYLTQTVSERTTVDSFYVSPEEARVWFESRKSKPLATLTGNDYFDIFSLDLDWEAARNITYTGIYKLASFPVTNDLSPLFKGGYYNMVFFKDTLQEIRARLLVFEPVEEYAISRFGRLSVKDFSGFTLQIDEKGAFGEVAILHNGVFTHYLSEAKDSIGTENIVELRGDPLSDCDKTWVEKIFDDLVSAGKFIYNFSVNTFNNWAEGGGPGHGYGGLRFSIMGSPWGTMFGPFGGSETHNGGSSNLRDYFKDEIFNNNQVAHQMVECFASYSQWNTPLIFATHRHTQDWDGHFVRAVNYYLTENSGGHPTSFGTALQTNFGSSTSNLYSPVGLNNRTQQAMLKVYQKMVLKYNGCRDDIYASTEGPLVFDLGNSELCECIKNYTTEEALEDFVNFYIELLPDDVKDKFNHLVEVFSPRLLETMWLLGSEEKINSLWEIITENEEDTELVGRLIYFMAVHHKEAPIDANALFLASEFWKVLQEEGISWPSTASGFNDDFWEILWEVVKDIIPELIPGVDTALDFKRAISSASQGDYWRSAEHFAYAMLSLTPVDKVKDLVKVVKSGRKAWKIFKLVDRLRGLGDEIAAGFKITIFDSNKMHHIFQYAPGHMPGMQPLLDLVGGDKESLVYYVYKTLHDRGFLTGLPLQVAQHPEFDLLGFSMIADVIRLPDGTIRVSDFYLKR